MNLEKFDEIKKLLSVPKKIVIVSHRNPDGDAYGSSLALYHYLLKFDHIVTVVSPNEAPEFLNWLPAQHKIVIFEKEIEK
jgi:phosphoesterase RecJ-like protein